jgi:hypothetical protein
VVFVPPPARHKFRAMHPLPLENPKRGLLQKRNCPPSRSGVKPSHAPNLPVELCSPSFGESILFDSNTMKNAIISFVSGVLIASAAWFGYVWYLQAKQAVEICGFFAGEAKFAEKLMAQAQSPSEETRLKTQRAAAMMIRGWVLHVDGTNQKYPFTKMKEISEPHYSDAVALVNKWEPELRRAWKEASEHQGVRIVEPGAAPEPPAATVLDLTENVNTNAQSEAAVDDSGSR